VLYTAMEANQREVHYGDIYLTTRTCNATRRQRVDNGLLHGVASVSCRGIKHHAHRHDDDDDFDYSACSGTRV
jgi:hypothetical protein